MKTRLRLLQKLKPYTLCGAIVSNMEKRNRTQTLKDETGLVRVALTTAGPYLCYGLWSE